jgi:hypothetical protein
VQNDQWGVIDQSGLKVQEALTLVRLIDLNNKQVEVYGMDDLSHLFDGEPI